MLNFIELEKSKPPKKERRERESKNEKEKMNKKHTSIITQNHKSHGKNLFFQKQNLIVHLATREINIPIICQKRNSFMLLCKRIIYIDIAKLGNAHTHMKTYKHSHKAVSSERIKVDVSPPRIQICQLIIQY